MEFDEVMPGCPHTSPPIAGQPVDLNLLRKLHQEAWRLEQAVQVCGDVYHHAKKR